LFLEGHRQKGGGRGARALRGHKERQGDIYTAGQRQLGKWALLPSASVRLLGGSEVRAVLFFFLISWYFSSLRVLRAEQIPQKEL
jgi:hypothetical protein